MTRNRTLAAAALVATLALTVSACGGSKGGGAGDGASKSASKGGFNAAVDKVHNPSDKKGGTLNLWSSTDVDSLDPGRAYYASVWNYERFYARTLLAFDGKPGKEGLKLVPDLAAAQPEIAADGKTYTFKLKSGLKFEDGSPITTKDIKYGIERIFAQDVVAGGPTYLINSLDQGQDYKGPYTDTDPNKLGLKTVETPDDTTIVFHLAKPDSSFPYLLAMGSASPVPQKLDTGAKYGDKPVSSGPYKFKSAEPGKGYELVRNEHWDPASDSFRKALPDVVKLTITTNADDMDARQLDGTADLDWAQTGLSQAAQAKVLTDPALKANTDNPYNGFIRFISLVPAVAPFDNIHCRKAVMYAADTTALQTARGGNSAGSLFGSMLPPNILGSDDYDPFGLTKGKPDVEKAKAELKECGKPEGFATTIAVRGNKAKEVNTAVALQTALKAINVTVNVEQYDGKLLASVAGSPDTVHTKGYGLIVAGWGADYPDGAGYMQPLMDGRFISKTGNSNYPETNDPEVNAWFDQAAAEKDPAKAAEIYKKINHKVVDGAVWLPVVADKALNYRNPRLTNVFINDAFGEVDFQALGVSDGK
ncbi:MULTISPECIES: ABC transporter substrate-binding protein [unclassified Kitasatospora]|uniref:ABC transporter substrate-binding protein n=1 Tax=unclassified Kitasatospora TaxID=2633591 RepID=UPI00070A2314|nr:MULTISPECIES: ABC transporter substrate-binding protein [unclassified Kitasatospora]KQV17354.1 peptide ABC transporter substrate-binding protein [Kitasatospora sp. Root107]KRB65556.1 peptide ABC transporter substrate-binding protein [Kitasatospora sp. Root187]